MTRYDTTDANISEPEAARYLLAMARGDLAAARGYVRRMCSGDTVRGLAFWTRVDKELCAQAERLAPGNRRETARPMPGGDVADGTAKARIVEAPAAASPRGDLRCTKCGETAPEQFSVRQRGIGRPGWCRKCVRAYNERYFNRTITPQVP